MSDTLDLEEFRALRKRYVGLAVEHLSLTNPARPGEVLSAGLNFDAALCFPGFPVEWQTWVAASAFYLFVGNQAAFEQTREQVYHGACMARLTPFQSVLLETDFLTLAGRERGHFAHG